MMNVAAPLLLTLTLVLPDALTGELQPAPAAPATADEDASAESLFRQGVEAYDARDFVHAIEKFNASYRLSRAPAILFDIGQAYGGLGDCRHALESFDAFVAAAGPDDPLVARARARQAELRPSCGAGAGPASPPGPSAPERKAPPPAMTIAAAPVPIHAVDIQSAPGTAVHFIGTPWGTTCVAAAGGALALAATGIALDVRASSLSSQVQQSPVWDSYTQRADARGHAFADSAAATFVAAGLTGAVAAVGCWMGWREASHRARSAAR